MIQEIITYITVAAAVAYAIYGLWKIIFPTPGKQVCSGGCSAYCGSKSVLFDSKKTKGG